MSNDSEAARVTEHAQLSLLDQAGLAAVIYLKDTSFTVTLPRAGEVGLGRDADAQLQLRATSVSRQHASLAIVENGEAVVVTDLGSRNGTYVNGVRLEAPRRVSHGDELSVGDARLLLLRRSAVPPETIAALTRDAFLHLLSEQIAATTRQGESLYLFVLQLSDRWDASAEARRALERLPRFGVFGLVESTLVGIVAPGTQAHEAREIERMIVGALATITARANVRTARHQRGMSAQDLLDATIDAVPTSSEGPAVTTPGNDEPVVASPAMRAVLDDARRFAITPLNVMVVGETGAGKEVLARYIHNASGRTGKLISVNAAALPEALLESELFGHERGAFSGANQAKVGLIEAAHGGTLFLDEIGELPLAMQAKLLRVLEDYSLRRVGSTVERKVDIRVVSATNRDLEEFVRERRFRQDLLFRLNACTLSLPPLRARKMEIPALARIFLDRCALAIGVPPPSITPAALAALERHDWPGNVRELRNTMDRAVALSRGEPILPTHLPDAVTRTKDAPVHSTIIPPYVMTAPPPSVGSLTEDPGRPIRDSVRDYERDKILAALDESGGNTTKAAALLGIPRRTLAYRMKRLGIT